VSPASRIVLATLNAKYFHAALGLRCLRANLGELRAESVVVEGIVSDRPVDFVERVLAFEPAVVGFGVYVWNAKELLAAVRCLKAVRPEVAIVLGGPEVSHEWAAQEIVACADYVIPGESDQAFAELCRALLAGRRPLNKVVAHGLPDLTTLALPYDEYDDQDVAHRIVYVEASRGCPYRCEFCLSALDERVRSFPLDLFLAAMQRLLDRGVRHFKFIDRTFNLSPSTSRRILEFFLDRYQPGMLLHFEMVPDRFPEPLRALIQRFPAGALQFEVGVQSFDPATCERIQRRLDAARTEDNLRFLREDTGVHVHADLIVGLPGEDVASFARGFDRLVALGPDEIQVGILKRLRGAPIARHDADWGQVYAAEPPYEILCNRVIDFATMQRLKRFARAWDLVANRGNFPRTLAVLIAGQSPFAQFLGFSDWLRGQLGEFVGIALDRLAQALRDYLVDVRGEPREQVHLAIETDYTVGGLRRPPKFLAVASPPLAPHRLQRPSHGSRQSRHLAHR
jgi:radical SAM superfamily enzyme YgiQ (UPF0313 family)